jgi:hypothetical protein
MARTPANDALEARTRGPNARDPELSIDPARGDDEDFEGAGQEYDQGEVTVVADASQLDILRETLGRLDAEPRQPMTSTIPAPPRGGAGPMELESIDARRGSSAPAPATGLSEEAARRAAELEAAHESVTEPETPLELHAPKPRVKDAAVTPPKAVPAERKTSTWLVIGLLLLAATVVAALYWARTHG